MSFFCCPFLEVQANPMLTWNSHPRHVWSFESIQERWIEEQLTKWIHTCISLIGKEPLNYPFILGFGEAAQRKHNEIKWITDRKLCQTAIVLHQPLIYNYEIAEKSPQQRLQDNMIMSAARTLWESLIKCQTITFITNSSDKLQWLPTDFISSWWWVNNTPQQKTLHQPLIYNTMPVVYMCKGV